MEMIKALLIEDNSADAALIREMLAESDAGIGLEWAGDLSSGLKRLEKRNLDILLLDLTLPDSYGLDTFARVREKTPDLPVMLLTGFEDEALAIIAVKAGAQDYLVKGQVDGKLLARSMRYAIERKKLLCDLENALEEIKTLKGLVPICAWCKKIRDDQGYWNRLEVYLKKYTGAQFTHGICPDCIKKIEKGPE